MDFIKYQVTNDVQKYCSKKVTDEMVKAATKMFDKVRKTGEVFTCRIAYSFLVFVVVIINLNTGCVIYVATEDEATNLGLFKDKKNLVSVN